jgi:hypothetical protein
MRRRTRFRVITRVARYATHDAHVDDRLVQATMAGRSSAEWASDSETRRDVTRADA